MEAVVKEERRVAYPLVLIFALIAAGIVASGYFYYRNYERHFRAEAENQLSAVAELKVDELAQYRKERLWDAATLFKNDAFSSLVRHFLEHPEDAKAPQQLQEWVAKYLATEQYDLVCLFDAQGVIRMSVPAGRPPISSVVSQRIPDVLRSGQVTWQDFHRNEHDQQVYLTLLVPILDGLDHSQNLGVLAMRINPETYLYPFIKRWPTPSQTAETLLVRRDGNNVLFLNELKFRTNTALNLRVSLENTNLPAVMAILGQEGVVEGADYRGEPSLAALHAVPDSSWFLVTKMDTAEVYAPLRERLQLTVLLAGLLLISTALGIGAIWRHQRSRFYKERFEMAEALRQEQALTTALMDNIPDAVYFKDAASRFIRANRALSRKLGLSDPARLTGKTDADFFSGEHARQALADEQDIIRTGQPLLNVEEKETWPDGTVKWVLTSKLPLLDAGGRVIGTCGISRDITERKQAQSELEKRVAERTVELSQERRLLRTLIDNLPDGIYAKDATGRKIMANPADLKNLGCQNEAEAIGKSDFDLFPKDMAEKFWADDQKVLQGEPVINREEFVLDEQGRERWLLTSKLPLRGQDGKIVGLVGIRRNITARKQAEEALRQSRDELERRVAERTAELARERQLLRTLIDRLPETFYIKDLDSHFLAVNEALARQSGKDTPDQMLGLSDADFFPAAVAAGFRAEELKVFDGEPIIDHENTMVFPDGREHTMLTTKLPFRDSQGRICGLVGIGHDITERKRAGEALRHEQTLMTALMDNVPDAVYFKDAASHFLRANRALSRKLGLSNPDQIVGKADADFFTREHARQALADEREIVRTGQPLLNAEEKETWPDGTITWVMTTKLPLRDAAGRIIGTCGISRDVTERKRAEETVRESQALYHSFVEQLPIGVFRKDREGRFVLVNPEFCRFKDMTAADFLGKSPREVAAVEAVKQGVAGSATKYAALGVEHHEQIMQTGKPIEVIEEYAKADGTKQFLRVIKLPVLGPSGKIIGTQGIQFDITERKRAEEALEQSSRELQERNDELARFTYTASHDLKSPLVTVKAFLGYLEQDTLNQDTEAIKKDRQYIYTAVDKMTRLLDELLDLARVGHKMNPPVEVPLQVVVKDALDMVAGWIIQHGVEVVVTKEPIMLCGDRTRLVEVFQNLVDNAIKFMGDQPAPRVEIGVEKAGDEHVFFVRDNGMGIDPRYQPKVFGLFEKYDPASKGTGIGLALVKRIVEVHGGKIWVESAGIGKGTTFRFTLAKILPQPAQP
jgi:PAS domain S-box-containing protein